MQATKLRSATIRGLQPIANRSACVLVLGSMPGAASLAAKQYYAHKQNLFWRLTGEIIGFDAKAPYARRKAALVAARIAVWDVVAVCRRKGSLDSAIEDESVVANDFATFLASRPRIRRVCFNGQKAEKVWRKLIDPRLPLARVLELRPLPSSSPANARMSYREKLRIWRDALEC